MLDLLGSLVDKSLVMLDEQDATARYRMLETIRDYAREKLEQQTANLADVCSPALRTLLRARQARARWDVGPEQAEWIQRIEADLDNVRSAMSLALAGSVDPFIAVKMAVALHAVLDAARLRNRGPKLCAQLRCNCRRSRCQTWPMLGLLYVGARLAESQSDHNEARAMLEKCLVLRRTIGQSGRDRSHSCQPCRSARLQAGDASGAGAGEREALKIFRELGDRRGEAIGLSHLAQIAAWLGDYEEARTQLEQCLAIAREIKYQELEGACELLLGRGSFRTWRTDGSRTLVQALFDPVP